MKKLSVWLLTLIVGLCAQAQQMEEPVEELTVEQQEQLNRILTDSVKGKTGTLTFDQQHFKLQVPEGYVYLDMEQSNHLLADYWGNRRDEMLLGTLLPDTVQIYDDADIAYVIFYEEEGYISDKDAETIDYDDLLKSIQEDMAQYVKDNPDLTPYELVGWAVDPKYDKNRKTLTWAKHLLVAGEHNVLNYDIRILGKKGYIVVQAIADLEKCPYVIAHENEFVESFSFNEGYTYADFDPKKDKIAEWTIGSLIAGKVLAKAGYICQTKCFSFEILANYCSGCACRRCTFAETF